MKTTRKEIIIFKAPAEDEDKNGEDAYKVTLEEAGITAHIVPVLTFEFFDLDRLRTKLQCPEEYSGLIFTSPRTVKAVALSLEGKTPSHFGWRNAYVVGETTRNVLQRELTMEGKGSNTGHAVALAEFILSEMQGTEGNHLPLLYPCGTLSVEPGGDRLSGALAVGGIHLDPVPSYRTCPHPDIEQNLRAITKKGLPEMVAFFSPSGVRFAVPVFRKLGIDLAALKIVAIGPTTEASLKTAGLTVWTTAEKPTPQHLTKAIIEHL
ncbi:uroporphyrinogen-III synthase-like [Schistocerca americana]|uniref:uroporphyrinogen-III synthase-like n=1 Tax=Schistocerca americana TaxID=7009 RepID=UPI001F4F59CA|nr:uroporphyrinogen-III synthase-like [Schistocerca americana]XP_047110334.1 uroporphyrinogen-III synthase-like [Schistocerca piceifrons]XP_049956361.1 uroporphyrinogen-III synthase-like [Schistocerca serialis cubense]